MIGMSSTKMAWQRTVGVLLMQPRLFRRKFFTFVLVRQRFLKRRASGIGSVWDVRRFWKSARRPYNFRCRSVLSKEQYEPVEVNIVLVSEASPPPGEEAIEWLLLTTLPIDSLEATLRVIEYYECRWMIEIFFKTLKSGCKVESLQFEETSRLEPCLGVYLIVAWRTGGVRETNCVGAGDTIDGKVWKIV